MSKVKVIHANTVLGQQGVNLVEKIVLGMGYVWEGTSHDYGIDGNIEIRDPASGAMKNLIVRAQVKAVGKFAAETPTKFEFSCDDRDITLWCSGNMPNILIVCRPSTDEAYWIPIKEYFADPACRKSKKAIFDKTADKFLPEVGAKLFGMARPKASGLYMAPPPGPEKLYSNLLPIKDLPAEIHMAPTTIGTRKEIWDTLKERNQYKYGEFIVANSQIVSVYDLRQPVWKEFCEQSASEIYKFDDWFVATDPDKQREAAQLLRRCLEGFVKNIGVGKGMRFSGKDECFYFVLPDNERGLSTTVEGEARNSRRGLIKAAERGNPPKIVGFRHVGFRSHFHNFDGQWYLEITPNNFYTGDDGRTRRGNSEDLRKGIKKIEKNHSVFGHINMWNHFLADKQQQDMLNPSYPYLSFKRAASFDCKYKIIDGNWKPTVSDEDAQVDNYEQFAI